MEPREKTWEEKKDMAYKGMPEKSSEGLEIEHQQKGFIKELINM